MTRVAVSDFQTANPLYTGATVTFYTVDGNGAKTTTKATIYDALTGSGTLSNPVTLDSEGKFQEIPYLDVPAVASVSGLSAVTDHDTGILAHPGSWRGTWATATVYRFGDLVVDGANGDDTGDIYRVASIHTSGTWATDKADATKLIQLFDLSVIVAGVQELALTTDEADNITDIAQLAHADGNIIVSDGTNWTAESGATARASLGLTSLANGLFDASILGFQTSELTIASGSVTGTLSRHTIAAESGVSDDLDTAAATNYDDGDIVWRRAASGHTIYVTTAGNFAQPVMLDDTTWVPFMWDDGNSKWTLLIGGWVKLDRLVLSSDSSADLVALIDGSYDEYLVKVTSLVPAVDNGSLLLQVSENAGVDWEDDSGDYFYHKTQVRHNSASYAAGVSATDTAIDLFASTGTDTGEGVSGELRFSDPANTSLFKSFDGTFRGTILTPLTQATRVGATYQSTNAINALRLTFSSGDIESGIITLYGLK